ncbi:hypothetical protein [Bradyrhizobium sp. RT7b]|uniref:hypothetical protein n=1 Tax=unclassified Bradyrhizobium TaxID=2631580 RepID=UPI003396FF3A
MQLAGAQEIQIGPAFSALTEKQRRFVLALFDAPRSHGSLTFAAKAAGYETTSRASLHSIAHQLGSDPKVEAAIAEISRQYLVTLGPRAVRAMRRVLDDDKHKDFGRVLGIVMDRVSPVQSTALVKVEHEAGPSLRAVANVTARILELAERAGVPAMIDVTPERKSA